MPNYRKAPITEAVIEMQTRPPAAAKADAMKNVMAGWEEQFPYQDLLRTSQIAFRFGFGEPTPADNVIQQRDAGWIFRSKDERRVVTAKLDVFSFSQLAPYDRWETFTDEARTFWKKYRDVVAPEAITRIGLRYINRFDIPLPIQDFKDFFRTTPEVSSDMPQELAGFFMQLQIPYPDVSAMLILTQTIVPPPQAGMMSMVLDIDFGCANNVPQSDDATWQLLNQLRVEKNGVFEACITDAARELIR